MEAPLRLALVVWLIECPARSAHLRDVPDLLRPLLTVRLQPDVFTFSFIGPPKRDDTPWAYLLICLVLEGLGGQPEVLLLALVLHVVFDSVMECLLDPTTRREVRSPGLLPDNREAIGVWSRSGLTRSVGTPLAAAVVGGFWTAAVLAIIASVASGAVGGLLSLGGSSLLLAWLWVGGFTWRGVGSGLPGGLAAVASEHGGPASLGGGFGGWRLDGGLLCVVSILLRWLMCGEGFIRRLVGVVVAMLLVLTLGLGVGRRFG